MGGNRLRVRLAQAGMGQDKIMIDLEQRQLLAESLCTLTRCGAASPHRRHMLTDGEVEAFHECRANLPAPGCQHLLHRLTRPADHTVTDAYQAAGVASS
jgi:hypothetical protein